MTKGVELNMCFNVNINSLTGLKLKILERVAACYNLGLIDIDIKNKLAELLQNNDFADIYSYITLRDNLPDELVEISKWIGATNINRKESK